MFEETRTYVVRDYWNLLENLVSVLFVYILTS